jgi:tryptophanyl-tRNA synthetase
MKKPDFHIDPYEISGEVDYNTLVSKFGVSPLQDLPKQFSSSLLFRRKIIFAHRDFGQIISAVENKKPFVMMTGLMPTGKFHLGHMIIAQQMIFYQSLGAKIYIAVADIEAYQARSQSLQDSKKTAIDEYIKNYIALGLKPKNLSLYFQSSRSQNGKESNAYYQLQNLLAKHATFNEFKAVYGDISPGKMLASLLQAADMFHPQLPEFEGPIPVVVPVGIDQDPHIRLARDISKRIKSPKLLQLSSTYNTFVPALSGPKGKMSSSNPNSYIALTDSPKEVETKIKKYAFSGGQKSLALHKKKGGNPDVDVSFQYLKFFFEPEDKKLAKIESDYKSGSLLTSELKDYTIKKINAFLSQHQKKINKITDKDIQKYLNS